MGREIEIPINITTRVNIDDIPTSELIAVLEDRGHAVDDEAVEHADTTLLIQELRGRSNWEYDDVPIAELIEALHHFGCPDNLIKHLELWDNGRVHSS